MAAETAARLTVGEVMPNFTYDTPFATGLTLSDTVQKTPKTALLFLRYYGCTLCQYDIHQLAENYHQITDVGGQVIVVLQSPPGWHRSCSPIPSPSPSCVIRKLTSMNALASNPRPLWPRWLMPGRC